MTIPSTIDFHGCESYLTASEGLYVNTGTRELNAFCTTNRRTFKHTVHLRNFQTHTNAPAIPGRFMSEGRWPHRPHSAGVIALPVLTCLCTPDLALSVVSTLPAGMAIVTQ